MRYLPLITLSAVLSFIALMALSGMEWCDAMSMRLYRRQFPKG